MSYNAMINYFKTLANAGTGVDADHAYGFQCVDIPLSASLKWGKHHLYGNAIDLLNSAKQAGYVVEYNKVGDPNSRPKAGAFFVQDTTSIYGHPFGHTGVVIQDSDGYTMKTIEQNIDGNADALYVGGPARYNTRDFNGVIGWFYIPQAQDKVVPKPGPSPVKKPEHKIQPPKPQPQEEINMLIVKAKDGNGTVYLHDGNKIVSLTDPNSVKSLKAAGIKEVTLRMNEINKMR